MLLNLQSVSKSYNGQKVLENISFQVNSGEALAIVGPSGTGKTTLLNLLGAMDTPDSGKIVFENNNLGELSEKELSTFRNQSIGFVFQMHYLLPQCTVLENVLIPYLAEKDKNVRTEAKARAIELLERVNMLQFKDKYPGELSGGECQRVAFVRALIRQPKLLLCDEPTGSLDQATANTLAKLLLDLNQENKTTLIVVTHSPELASKMEKIYELKDFQLFAK
jgi:lipoprotein-releasing system ATP-binding protein